MIRMLLYQVLDVVVQRRSRDIQCKVLGGNVGLVESSKEVANFAGVTR